MKVPVPVRLLTAMATKAWFTPPPLGAGAAHRDSESLAGLTPLTISGSPDLTGFEVGSGPLVLAVHGWGGRAAQMAPLARRVAEHGMRVVAVDLPGHAGSQPTDIKAMEAAIRRSVEQLGDPAVVVAHSLGAMAVKLAFPHHAPPAVVFVAPAVRVSDALRIFGERARLMQWVRSGLRRRLEAWDPAVFAQLDLLAPEQLPGAAMLILHDPDDDNTPFTTAAELARRRPDTTIVAIPGAGHGGILSHPDALERVSQFVVEKLTPGPVPISRPDGGSDTRPPPSIGSTR